MSTANAMPAALPDPHLPSQQIARRVRGLLAENQITQKAMAMALGLDTTSFNRRYKGSTSWSLDELGTLADNLNVSFADLVRVEQRPAAPGGGQAFLPLGEGFGAPSGTRTPNPLIPRVVERDNVVPLRKRLSSTPTRHVARDTRLSSTRTRHLRSVGQAAS